MLRCVIAWLSYLTQNNYDKRIINYVESLTSLRGFIGEKTAETFIVDNSDNPLCDNWCRQIGIPFNIFKADNVCYDVAVHFSALKRAQDTAADYFIYTYDDFVFYDCTFLSDAIKFMDDNPDVRCIRLPAYDVKSIDRYTSELTPKSKNPDAVSHANALGGVVKHSQVIHVGTHDFYKSNWRPNSRPTLWRTKDFNPCVDLKACPTMQPFEKRLYDAADSDVEWCSGFIDKGTCHTFPEKTSERMASGMGGNPPHLVNVETLFDMMNDEARWVTP